MARVSYDQLRAILERVQAATPGPWRWWDVNDSGGGSHQSAVGWSGPGRLLSDRSQGLASPDAEFDDEGSVLYFPEGALAPRAEDVDFIAAARTDILDLIETCLALMEEAGQRGPDVSVPVQYGVSVYFIQGEPGGPIKIGVSVDVRSRLALFQSGSPLPLRILATQPGGRTLEAALHRRFAADRLHGEWFQASEALLGYIKGLQG